LISSFKTDPKTIVRFNGFFILSVRLEHLNAPHLPRSQHQNVDAQQQERRECFVETIAFLGCGRDSFAFSNLRAGGDCPREGFARFPVCSHNASLCPGVLTPASLHAIAVDLEGREGRASGDEKFWWL